MYIKIMVYLTQGHFISMDTFDTEYQGPSNMDQINSKMFWTEPIT